MAISTCTVSGTVKSLLNSGISNVTVKAGIIKPFLHTDGTLVPNYEVSTTTDSNGAWSLILIETATPNSGDGIPMTISFEFSSGGSGDYRKLNYTAIIPNTSTCNFSALTSLTPAF